MKGFERFEKIDDGINAKRKFKSSRSQQRINSKIYGKPEENAILKKNQE